MRRSLLLFYLWVLLALVSLLPVSLLLQGSFPLFTLLWLLVPLIAVARGKDPARVGFRPISWREFFRVAAVNLGALLLLMLLFEPWSHTYHMLVEAAILGDHPDTTFAWLVRLPRLPGLAGMFLYSGLVTLFGEEMFFRGWLLQRLQRRIGGLWALVIQALLFTLPNLLASLLLPSPQGALYAVVYTFLGIGLVGGWAAWRTQSIWPSLFSAAVTNLLMVLWTLSP